MAGQVRNQLSEQDEGQPPRTVGIRGADGVVYALSGVCGKSSLPSKPCSRLREAN